MLKELFEQSAAKSNLRFEAFVKGKEAYNSFLQEIKIGFPEMDMEFYERVRSDQRIQFAIEKFNIALELSEKEGNLSDVATAKYQIGLIYHLRGELDEAEQYLIQAKNEFVNERGQDRIEGISGCHYHLGIIAYKRGFHDKAVWALKQSRQLDELYGNIGGMSLCDVALDFCAEAGANLDKDVPFTYEIDEEWNLQDDDNELEMAKETNFNSDEINDINKQRHNYNQRELICLASYSDKVNDQLMEYLNSLENEFGRPVNVTRVAFGSNDPSHTELQTKELDQHLCAIILVLEKKGIYDYDFRKLLTLGIKKVINEPDFRFIIYLNDLEISELREIADNDALIAELFDTTQISEFPTLLQLGDAIVPFVRSVENIKTKAIWENFRLKVTYVSAKLATAILLVFVVISLAGYPVWFLKLNIKDIAQYYSYLSSFALGILLFPLQAPLMFLLFRGFRNTFLAQRDSILLKRYIVISYIFIFGASILQSILNGPKHIIFLGLLAGILLDSIRRSGKQAKRQLINVEEQKKYATKYPWKIIVNEDSFNPFYCPLLPVFSARIFLSYTKHSAKGSRFSSSLYKKLKESGASPFLDRISIPYGSGWRRELNDQLGKCDAFISVLDKKSVKSEWVAAEIITAIKANRISATPEVILLLDTTIQNNSSQMLPFFKSIINEYSKPSVDERPRVITINSQTISSLSWILSPKKFVSRTVFTRLSVIPVYMILTVLMAIAAVGILAGYILGLFAFFEMTLNLPFTIYLADHGITSLITLLTAFWCGFTSRSAITFKFESGLGDKMNATMPGLAAIGLVYALFVLIPHVTLLIIAWSIMLFTTGWLLMDNAILFRASSRRK